VGRNGIFADSDYGNVKIFEFLKTFRKSAGLAAAARGVVSRIKIEHNFSSKEGRKGNFVSVFIGKNKIRGFGSFFKHL
jgi:hypothetical protein